MSFARLNARFKLSNHRITSHACFVLLHLWPFRLSVANVTLSELSLCPGCPYKHPAYPLYPNPGKVATSSAFIPVRCSFVYFSLVRTPSCLLHLFFPLVIPFVPPKMGGSFLSSFSPFLSSLYLSFVYSWRCDDMDIPSGGLCLFFVYVIDIFCFLCGFLVYS